MADVNELLRSRHVFGAAANVDSALEQNTIDAYDILFLKDENDMPVIGWIDKNGNKVIYEDKKQVTAVEALPETGDAETIYLVGSTAYVWDGEKFAPIAGETVGVDETIVDEKISTAKEEMVAYTDEQIASMFTIVEI